MTQERLQAHADALNRRFLILKEQIYREWHKKGQPDYTAIKVMETQQEMINDKLVRMARAAHKNNWTLTI